jgi:uncharacterized membrane protein YdbT with pleckstrin-like domain
VDRLQAMDTSSLQGMAELNQARHAPEARELWSDTEGQISNAGLYLLCLLTFWLVVPVLYAGWRYLWTARHRYTLTHQRLLIESGVLVRDMESLELYRVRDLSVQGTLLQTLVGRGRIVLQTTDVTTPVVSLNAISNAKAVAQLVRDAVERCRVDKGVRAFDV